jgi:hypothetical protein
MELEKYSTRTVIATMDMRGMGEARTSSTRSAKAVNGKATGAEVGEMVEIGIRAR